MDLDSELAARLDFDRARLWQREHTFDDWRQFERDLPFLIPYRHEPDQHLLLCLTRWISNRTLSELIRGPEELRQLAPQWPIRFWDLADRTSEELLAASSPWLNALAVVRATREESDRFRSVFATAVERLAGLAAQQRMRWHDLMWMLISWAIRRRPYDERPGLVEVAMEYQADPNTQKEVQIMSTTLRQTLEELAEQRGIEQGRLQNSREMLCWLLEDRFGPLPEDLRQQIEQIKDLARLERSIRQCPRLDSLDELEL